MRGQQRRSKREKEVVISRDSGWKFLLSWFSNFHMEVAVKVGGDAVCSDFGVDVVLYT
jgi:hypothetical protein